MANFQGGLISDPPNLPPNRGPPRHKIERPGASGGGRMSQKTWFEVDTDGFRALQSGKPKTHAIRELIQNALDEDVTSVIVTTHYDRGNLMVSVTDDGPGFRDLKDAWTLFADTYKRPDPEMRGRFNMGEKQAFSICRKARIETTSGTVEFDEAGRHRRKYKRESGTKVSIEITKVTRDEFNEIKMFVENIIVPEQIIMTIDDKEITHGKPLRVFETKLATEYLKDGEFRKTTRNTKVEIWDTQRVSTALLFEMGIPVCEIDCKFDINVLQRIPMSMDRDKVFPSYMQDLFAEVLNETHNQLAEDESSDMWVRAGMSDSDRINENAVNAVITKRFGDKPIIVTPNDPQAKDRAIADGCTLITGSMMNREEWETVKQYDVLKSTSNRYGWGESSYSNPVKDMTENMMRIAELTKKIGNRYLGKPISVDFVETDATPGAWYGHSNVTFNVTKLGKGFFDSPLSQKVLDLIIHEIPHEYGMHTERGYLDAVSELGAMLTVIALNEPEFFDGGTGDVI